MELLFSDQRENNAIDTIEKKVTIALQTTFDKFALIRTITITHKMKPWVMPAMFKAMKERGLAFKRASLSHCPIDINENKHLRSKDSYSLEIAKRK